MKKAYMGEPTGEDYGKRGKQDWAEEPQCSHSKALANPIRSSGGESIPMEARGLGL
jgi:hypothetical protein